MKRAILLSSLVLSIIGTLTFSIIANVQGDKYLDTTMDYVIGDKSLLEDLKIKQEISKGQYAKKTLLISKDGVKDEGVNFTFNQPDEYIKDKKLFRGIEYGSYVEDDSFSVIIKVESKKGIFIRYKYNNDYKEFSILNDIIKYNSGSIYDVFLKDGEVYFIYRNNKSESFLMRVNLTSEKMVESIKMDTEKNMYFASSSGGETGYIKKDNKVYMPALDKDYNIRVFCYDLSSKSLTFKDIKTFTDLKRTAYYRIIGDEIKFISYDNHGNLEVSFYNILNDKKGNNNVKLPINKEYRYININQFKEKEECINLCGEIVDFNNESIGFIAGIDKKANSIKYFAKFNDCSRFNYRLMIQ